MNDQIGWGSERITYTREEAEGLGRLIADVGGSIHDALSIYLRYKQVGKEEVLRLLYIAENHARLARAINNADWFVELEK